MDTPQSDGTSQEIAMLPFGDMCMVTKVRQTMKRFYIQVSYYDRSVPKYDDVLNCAKD